MKLLAIDTSMQACSAAIYDAAKGSILAHRCVHMDRGQAEALAPMVSSVLAEAGLRPEDLDRIAVTTGPGTFTGVRIGLAMARGLGLALDIPVIGINSLLAIAQNEKGRDRPVMVAADARPSEIYVAVFDAEGRAIVEPSVLTLTEALARLPAGPVTVMGSAADAVIAATARTGLVRSRVGDLPVASAFAPLAATMPVTSAMPSPLYLRAAGAKPQPRNLRNRPAVVREATALEAPLLAELHAECFETPWASEDFARLMAMPGAVSLIASDQDKPLGFALLRRAADEVEILTIGTRPAARRRGVAKALIDDQSRFLATQGIVSLFIEVACSNAAAQALYRACGFAETARRKAYYERAGGYREDAIIMRKDIG